MKVGELKALLKDVNDDVEVVVKPFLQSDEVIRLLSVLSVVEDDGSIPVALLISESSRESIHSTRQRAHFPVWYTRSV